MWCLNPDPRDAQTAVPSGAPRALRHSEQAAQELLVVGDCCQWSLRITRRVKHLLVNGDVPTTTTLHLHLDRDCWDVLSERP